MPSLHLPALDLPRHGDPGRALAQLGAPPEAGSIAADRDTRISRDLIAQRTPAGDAWARAQDLHGATQAWRELAARVGPGIDQGMVQSLVGAAMTAASTQAGIAKRLHGRPRPFEVDLDITVIGRTPRGADSSWPSGHSARSYAAARVIATLDPALEGVAYALAQEVAVSRIYAGVHFASDVVAGALLGVSLADSLLERWRGGKPD